MTPRSEIPFNVNGYVKVKLTDVGRKIWFNKTEKLYKDHPNVKELLSDYQDPEITPDADGYCTYQLWELMKTYGEHIYNGCKVPFETEIIFVKERL